MNTTDANTDYLEFQATILDKDNRLLASGRVRLYTKLNSGTFWLPGNEDAHKIPTGAAILQAENGSVYSIKKFRPCSAHLEREPVNHCDFEYAPLVGS